MDERTGQSEAEIATAMTSSISDLTYFRRQVNESLMKLQRSVLAERQDGDGHVTAESPSTVSGGEVCVGVFSVSCI